MIQKRKEVDGTEITATYDGTGIVSVSECPDCGADGMDVRGPADSGRWSCDVCGFDFWLSE